MELEIFLKKCKTKDKKCTFVSLCGGKYTVPDNLAEEFLELYQHAKFDEDHSTALCWRPPPYFFKPLFFDIDLHLKKDVDIPNEAFVELANMICFWV